MKLETVVCVLLTLIVLSFLAVFLRHGLAKRPKGPEELSAFIEYGLAQSEIGLAWVALQKLPGLALKDEWGSGRLATAIQKRLEELERVAFTAQNAAIDLAQRERALAEAMKEIATCMPTGRDSLVAIAQRAITENDKLRAGGEAADTGPGAGLASRRGQ